MSAKPVKENKLQRAKRLGKLVIKPKKVEEPVKPKKKKLVIKKVPTFEEFWLEWVNEGNDEDYYNEGRKRGTERAAARRDAKKIWKKKFNIK